MSDVVALVPDLFFQAKLLETAKRVGVSLKVARGVSEALGAAAQASAALLLVDLSEKGAVEFVRQLRESGSRARIVGFLSHVQTDLAAQAKAAGCTEVLPRSKFTAQLPAILAAAKARQAPS